MQPVGTLIIVGASGTGKTTLLEELLKLYPHASKVVTYTTRASRPGERHMKDYYFCSEEEYMSLRDKNFFAESEHVHGRWYGTPAYELTEKNDVLTLLCIDIKGAKVLKEKYPYMKIIAVEPPSIDALEYRLRRRAQDSEENIQERLENAKAEIHTARTSGVVDLFVVNDDFTVLWNTVKTFIECEMIAKV